MFAIIEVGGKQYKVAENDEIYVEKLTNKVGEKVTYRNRNGYKHGQIVGVIEDKDNKEKYYKVKWNDNGKTQKINVRDSSLEPSGVDWYPRW